MASLASIMYRSPATRPAAAQPAPLRTLERGCSDRTRPSADRTRGRAIGRTARCPRTGLQRKFQAHFFSGDEERK